jgi:hypothetical protein
MPNDMVGALFKTMGFDPALLIAQAQSMGAAFASISETQAKLLLRITEIGERLESIENKLTSMQGALGLYVEPPNEKMLALIEAGTREHLRQFNTDRHTDE